MAGSEFTRTFIIDGGTWETYLTFIQNLRAQVADPNIPPCRTLRQLPRENHDTVESRRRWFAVVLQAGDTQITLRIRRENLYLDAYQMMNGRWVEYNSAHGRLYPNSILLRNCDGSYPQLEDGTPGRGNIGLTLETLTAAVTVLAYADGGSVQARTDQIVVIQMICESLRLQSITQYLVEGHAITGAPNWMIGREGSWARLSRIFLAIVADRFQPFDQPQEFIDETQIWSATDVINALGIVKPEPEAPNQPGGRRPRRMADSNDFHFGGGPKVEVFEFRINKIEEEITPAKLYGTVTGKDVFTHSLYNRVKTNPEEVYAGDFPLLTGQIVAPISACDPFTIDVNLWDKHNYGPDCEISKGIIQWNVCNLGSGKEYDRFIEEELAGYPGCSATVRYAVFGDAVGATIEVVLINGDGEDPTHVYGDISAVNNKVIEGESVLLRKGKDGRIDVKPGAVIPLSRSIVAVPFNSNLHVRAKLWHHNWLFRDVEIANGFAKFKPKRFGTDTQKITGEYGEIQVKVTWKI